MPINTGKKLHLINIRVDDAMREELRRRAKEENRAVSNYIATVLQQHLERLQAEEDAQKKK